MTARKEHSRRPRAGSGALSNGRNVGKRGNEREIGWGLSAEGEQDDILMRRALFSILVAVLGCMGGWFLLTTLSSGGNEQRVLKVPGSRPGTVCFAVELREFPASDSTRAIADELASRAAMRALAGGHKFYVLKLPEGGLAFCCGRFESQDSPEMDKLLQRFRNHRERGSKVFPAARVISYTAE
ncbi:MAG: hypothetical protein ACYS8L_07020 [Planctomycetota bacterium]|jgi:hypothetical protein